MTMPEIVIIGAVMTVLVRDGAVMIMIISLILGAMIMMSFVGLFL